MAIMVNACHSLWGWYSSLAATGDDAWSLEPTTRTIWLGDSDGQEATQRARHLHEVHHAGDQAGRLGRDVSDS